MMEDMASRSQPVTATANAATPGSEPSAAFTPGPWAITSRAGADCYVTAPDYTGPNEDPLEDPWNIAIVVGACGYPNDPRTGCTDANASLIAAAPDMYEALREAASALRFVGLFDMGEEKSGDQGPIDAVRAKVAAALAKAEGRQ